MSTSPVLPTAPADPADIDPTRPRWTRQGHRAVRKVDKGVDVAHRLPAQQRGPAVHETRWPAPARFDLVRGRRPASSKTGNSAQIVGAITGGQPRRVANQRP